MASFFQPLQVYSKHTYHGPDGQTGVLADGDGQAVCRQQQLSGHVPTGGANSASPLHLLQGAAPPPTPCGNNRNSGFFKYS
jgi:hypothetical protein